MKILLICQWFPPEYAPIGVMLKELAEDLASKSHAVTIITGYPNYPAGIVFSGFKKKLFSEKIEKDIRVIRCYLYTSPKRTFLRRLLNYVSFAITSFVAALKLEKHDVLFMVSPPLTNGIIAAMLTRLKGFKFIFNVQDIYPDAAVSAGVIKNKLLIQLLKKIEFKIYRAAHTITVISDGFRENLIKKGVPESKIKVIHNWLDPVEITPKPKDNEFSRKHYLSNKFVVLYSGTIGIISGANILLQCAEKLTHINDILFLFVGDGIVKDRIVKEAKKKHLKNMQFFPFQPREMLPDIQSCSDVSVVTLQKGQGKFSVPSKVLGYMAAARPIIASVDDDSDTSLMIEKAECGICVAPQNSEMLTAAILELYYNRNKALQLGLNGRQYLLKQFDRKTNISLYEKLFLNCIENSTNA